MKKLAAALLTLSLSFSALAEKVKEGDAFPTDLAGVKLVDIKTKKEVKLASLVKSGKVVILDFWASWCEPCKEALPALNKLYGKYKGKGLVVVGINVDENPKDRDTFLSKHKVSFPLLSDEGLKLIKQMDIKTMPTSFVLDGTGTVQMIHKAFRTGDDKKYEAEITKRIR